MSIEITIDNGLEEKIVQLDENMSVKEAKEKTGEVNSSRWFLKKPHRRTQMVMSDDQTLSYYKIKDGDVIFTTRLNNKGGGGFGLNTIDVSKNNTKIIGFDHNAPFYRIVGYGLSIQAKCGNDCEAKDKIVYCPIGFVQDYDILQNLEEIRCPACKNEVYPKNFGFLKCKYKIDYTKWENNKKETGTVEGQAGEEFKLFSEYSGNANFSKLVFNVTHK